MSDSQIIPCLGPRCENHELIEKLRAQLAEQKLLHEQTAEQLKQCEGALEKRNATCDELRAQLAAKKSRLIEIDNEAYNYAEQILELQAQLAERDALLTWRKWPEEMPTESDFPVLIRSAVVTKIAISYSPECADLVAEWCDAEEDYWQCEYFDQWLPIPDRASLEVE